MASILFSALIRGAIVAIGINAGDPPINIANQVDPDDGRSYGCGATGRSTIRVIGDPAGASPCAGANGVPHMCAVTVTAGTPLDDPKGALSGFIEVWCQGTANSVTPITNFDAGGLSHVPDSLIGDFSIGFANDYHPQVPLTAPVYLVSDQYSGGGAGHFSDEQDVSLDVMAGIDGFNNQLETTGCDGNKVQGIFGLMRQNNIGMAYSTNVECVIAMPLKDGSVTACTT